jgi:hypothetical protein
MRVPMRFIVVLGFVVYVFGLGCRVSHAQGHKAVEDLFQKLQSPMTTDGASDRLEKMAETDASARAYLVHNLPALIDHGPRYYQPPPNSALKYPVWLNLVRLAKDLAIVETTPALAKWIGVTTSPITTLTTATDLEDSPAGQALIQIGDPSIPALQEVLAHGKTENRWDATYALRLINSPKARAALQEHIPHEADESLADFTKNALSRSK